MRKLIYLLLIIFSCKENKKEIFIEKQINISNIIIPKERLYVELIDYYPALDSNQLTFYVVKNIQNNDTLFVLNNLPIYDFIKNYEGVNNTAITLEKIKSQPNREKYIIRTSPKYNINNKKIYFGELINIVD